MKGREVWEGSRREGGRGMGGMTRREGGRELEVRGLFVPDAPAVRVNL